MLVVGSKIKLKEKMGVFDNVGEICEVVNILEDGTICFKFGGCHLGYMSYKEYERYFDSVEEKKKKPWTEWCRLFGDNPERPMDGRKIHFMDVIGFYRTYSVLYRENGKKVQVKMDGIKAEASCAPEDFFDLKAGLRLAEMRWIVKYNKRAVDRIAKKM